MYLNVLIQNSHVIVSELKTNINENLRTLPKFAEILQNTPKILSLFFLKNGDFRFVCQKTQMGVRKTKRGLCDSTFIDVQFFNHTLLYYIPYTIPYGGTWNLIGSDLVP